MMRLRCFPVYGDVAASAREQMNKRWRLWSSVTCLRAYLLQPWWRQKISRKLRCKLNWCLGMSRFVSSLFTILRGRITNGVLPLLFGAIHVGRTEQTAQVAPIRPLSIDLPSHQPWRDVALSPCWLQKRSNFIFFRQNWRSPTCWKAIFCYIVSKTMRQQGGRWIGNAARSLTHKYN